MTRLLIDTNIYSSAFRGHEEIVFNLQKADLIGISAISIGELLNGFKGGDKERQNRSDLEAFLDSPRVALYPVDMETADFYAQILDALRKQGTPIPTNDIWIAATAFQNGLKMYTQDKHFIQIPGINLLR
ncbi:MAG: type II toxin-antitoxin system VapC family toxin [Proteobacteria bacterium]|nr:type II toxin-antitoxin system VapC family toxin [Pseudomonadota bacterium]MBU1386350.1 type II toxin-antitoxin system VapC family toxin [Pseudomonadota bacterium]MBU1541364.1 type II toxin-antitoxin system VapC family toxin [Pseudomonadota bacterium]MBU2482511.1 type II toxin-antitoxin system VapC family toxin [Pseudomonadota bacterium]